MDGYIDIAVLPAETKPKRASANTARTIEDQLEAKAQVSDRTDYAARRSLGQMTREEQRRHLFGG